MKSWKVMHRLLVLAGVLLLGTVIVFVAGYVGMRSTVASLETIYADRVVPLRDLKVIADMYAVNIVDTAHKARNGNLGFAAALKNVDDAETMIAKKWKEYTATFLVADEKRLVAEIEPMMKATEPAIDRLKELLKRGDAAGLAAYTANELYPAIDPLSGKFSDLIEIQLTVAGAEYADGETRSQRLILISIAIVIAALVGGSVLAVMITRQITSQLGAEPSDVVAVARCIAAGELNVAIGEMAHRGSIMEAMRAMRDRLHDIVAELSSTAESLSAAAQRTSMISATVAASSDKQSSSTASMAAAVEEMTVSIGLISESAGIARSTAADAGARVDEGMTAVQQTLGEMGKITNTVVATANDIENLAVRSTQIGAIVNVIREIADQTNLLALNAAIEAARAGEQGRGFAVVADEVRKLAERTAKSTQEIVQTVATIHDGTQQAIRSTEAGRVQAVEGVRLADLAGGAMRDVKAAIDEALAAVGEISHSLAEQRATSTSVAQNVEKVAQMTEENAASVAQLNEAAGSLNNLATKLRALTGHFKT